MAKEFLATLDFQSIRSVIHAYETIEIERTFLLLLINRNIIVNITIYHNHIFLRVTFSIKEMLRFLNNDNDIGVLKWMK